MKLQSSIIEPFVAYMNCGKLEQLPILTLQQILQDSNANNLTHVIVDALFVDGGLSKSDSTTKLVCFNANRLTIFQNNNINIIV
jgi:hypothetical protein